MRGFVKFSKLLLNTLVVRGDTKLDGNLENTGNIAVAGNISATDITASGDVDAVDITASGDVDAVDVAASGEASGGTAVFGSGSDYIDINALGQLTLNGAARGADDLRVPLSNVKRLGFTDPDWVKVVDNGAGSAGVYALGFDDGPAEEEVFFAVQIPHTWAIGGLLHPHVHWGPAGAGGGNVVWGLEYTWQNYGGFAFPNSAIITTTGAAGVVASSHNLTNFATIDGVGKIGSSMLLCRLFRNATDAADTLSGDAFLYEIDFHFEIDKFGEYDFLP